MEIIDTHPDTCFVCNKHFKQYRLLKMNKEVGLREVDIKTAHISCNKLVRKRQKLLDDLLEVEYDLFAKRC
jgi:hypothetical protein